MKPMITVAAILVALALGWLLLPVPEVNSPAGAHADDAVTAPPASDFTLRAERMFTGSKWLIPGLVEVRDGQISRVGSDFEPAADLPLLDLGDRTLLPGLIDAHVHAFGTALVDALNFGVTTVLDQANDSALIETLRQAAGAQLFASGPPATAPGGHGTQYGYTPPPVTGPADAADFARTIEEAGSDWMKIIIERGMGNWRMPSLDRDTVAALVTAAEQVGLKPVAHVSELETAHWAIAAGAHGLVHIFADQPADDALLALMVADHRFIVPTLVVMESVAGMVGTDIENDDRIGPWLSAEQRGSLAQRWPGPRNPVLRQRVLENVRAMHAAGIPILAGSDAPNPGTAHGLSLHRELALLIEAGLSTSEALAAATALPARHFGLDDRGLLEPGRRAALLVIDGDPREDISATLDIHAIWQAGQPVARVQADTVDSAPVPAHGRLSDFRPEAAGAEFGLGLEPTDDQMAGGNSVVEMQSGGDENLAWVRLRGEIRSGFGWPWAGAMFSPGSTPMTPVDLSGFSTLHFKARGEPAELRVMVFSPALGAMPATQTVSTRSEWQSFELKLSGFAGADPAAISGLVFVAGPGLGEFAFDLAEVRLE
ncbi:MAG: amidohydrolase family protein [Wenzhouxiangella sp.]|nr:amidohydrolase family protein [Wenzhouxiangella sp.]